MAVSTKVEPLDVQVMFGSDGGLSPKEQSRAFAEFARRNLIEAQQKNMAALGRVPDHTTHVDGRETEQLETVRPLSLPCGLLPA